MRNKIITVAYLVVVIIAMAGWFWLLLMGARALWDFFWY
jgi:hypothetical protein